MQHITLGQSDLRVTPICLGTMTFGEQVNEADSHAILSHSLARGVNFIDTAEMYSVPARAETFGATETIIGNWFAKNPGARQKLVLATKVAGLSDVWDLERIYGVFPRLKERQHHLGSQLSGGEQQMLAIGRALSTNPRLLILDEATEGLAPVIREEIWRCLAALKAAGQTILVVDKYVHRLMDLADRHLILERGRMVWEGDSAALNADRRLWERYLAV